MLLQLLALAAVAVQGADPGDALAGVHKGSVDIFAYGDGSTSLVGRLNEVFGGDTVAEMSGEMCPHMNSVDRFEDMVCRATTIRARDYSCGDMSVVTDCHDIRGIHQNGDRVAEYTDSAKETTKLFHKFGLINKHWEAGPTVRFFALFGAAQVAVALNINGFVLDSLGRLPTPLPWHLMFVPICFFGAYVLICIYKKGITYWKGKPYVNKIINFNEKRQMHAWLAYHMMQSCVMTAVMQMNSTVDPENIAAFVEGLKAAGQLDAPITRLPQILLKKPPSQSEKTTAMSDGDDIEEDLDSDDEDEIAAAEAVDDVDVIMATLGASFDASFRVEGTQKDWSIFLQERKDKEKKELEKVEKTKVFDGTRAADNLEHIGEVGYDGPTTKDDLRDKLEGLYKETNELEKKGITVVLKDGESLVQVVWAGTSQKKNAYFPPVAVRNVPKPFHVQKRSLLNLAGVWLFVRTLAIFPLFCLFHTCREKWSSRKKYVRNGKFVLVGAAAQTLVLVEPSAWLIWWFLIWLWKWLKQRWPSTMNGFPFVTALYILAADGVTLTRVKKSGAWRPGVAETPVMPDKMYLHSKKETYASANNKDGKGNVLDVIDAAVLNDFIKVGVRVPLASRRWRGGSDAICGRSYVPSTRLVAPAQDQPSAPELVENLRKVYAPGS